MKRPQVLILAENDFHRRLMSDVVNCNEMRAVASDRLEWLGKVERGSYQADVVVLDFGMKQEIVAEAMTRLESIPIARRPRIVGWARESDKHKSYSTVVDVDKQFAFPLDVGCFARVVQQQAQAHVLAGSS